jgi:hypothetical protein
MALILRRVLATLVLPETFEPILRQRSIPRCVLDISVSKIGLQGAGNRLRAVGGFIPLPK